MFATKANAAKKQLSTWFVGIAAAAAVGFVGGYLIGISASPVVSGFIAGILTLVGILAKPGSNEKANPQTHLVFPSVPLVAPPPGAAQDAQANAIERTFGYWSVLVAITASLLLTGLKSGLYDRTHSQEIPIRHLPTFYKQMGFDEQQVKAILENDARTLAGGYRNLVRDCGDLGLTAEQTQRVVEKLINDGQIKPRTLADSQAPAPAKTDSEKASDKQGAAQTATNPRLGQAFSGDGASWLDTLLGEVPKVPENPSQDELADIRKVEGSIIERIVASKQAVAWAAKMSLDTSIERERVNDYFSKLEAYLNDLTNLDSRKSLFDRKFELRAKRDSLNEILKPRDK